MSLDFSYRHLYYFWVVAREGGISRAAARLGMAVQTVSAQVRELERELGHALLRPAGRGVALTEAGEAAMHQADLIFQLGEQLPERVRGAATQPVRRLQVGVGGGVPKLVTWRLLQPVLDEPDLRLKVVEQPVDDLLADLALHRLDLALVDRAPAPHPGLRLRTWLLGVSPVAWYAPPALLEAAQADFPRSLARVPVLLPLPPATMRQQLDPWFEREGVRPRIAGEFEDSALLKTFGARGLGVFPAAEWVEEDLLARYGVCRIGGCAGVDEPFHAVCAERSLPHPLVARLMASGPVEAGPVLSAPCRAGSARRRASPRASVRPPR